MANPSAALTDRTPGWRRARLETVLVGGLSLGAIIAGATTFAAITNAETVGQDQNRLIALVIVDLIILLLLAVTVGGKLWQIFQRRRMRRAGALLHSRMAGVFGFIAVVPAVLVAVFSAFVFYFGVQAWFAERVSTAVGASLSVAQAYLEEHQKTLRADAVLTARNIDIEAARLIGRTPIFNQFLTAQAQLRGLQEVLVIDGERRVLARAALTLALQFEPIPEETLELARGGDVALMPGGPDDRIRAVARLERFIDSFVIVGRDVAAEVGDHMERAEIAVDEYRGLQDRVNELQIAFVMLYLLCSLLLLMLAIWAGLQFADALVGPIGALIAAAERYREGDLAVRVSPSASGDEIAQLGTSFNRMAAQLASQRDALVTANDELDQRRRFIETVLSGVSAGVLAVDPDGHITLHNGSAEILLGLSRPLTGQSLSAVLTGAEKLLADVAANPERAAQAELQVTRPSGDRALLVRVVAEPGELPMAGYIVTFDDVTELLNAQRKAAWADVARRIAHEIKNPLTPIQLAAERLRRRYLSQIEKDPETFEVCVDTIVRQVGDIGRMVNEFSAFARMPVPTMQDEDLVAVVEQALFLQKTARADIAYTFEPDDWRPRVRCDAAQVTQVLTNVLQNAADAIDGREADGELERGHIRVDVAGTRAKVVVTINDNGRGLPVRDRDRLTEPYVTTRAKGTGLGLAIVKKIMEDHGGRIVLEDGRDCGTSVRLIFPHNDTTIVERGGAVASVAD